jgi:hypothetical protein
MSPFAHAEIRTTAVAERTADLAPIIKVGPSNHVMQHLSQLITLLVTPGVRSSFNEWPETWRPGTSSSLGVHRNIELSRPIRSC